MRRRPSRQVQRLRIGVLPDHELRACLKSGGILSTASIEDWQFQPASLDLRLGTIAYQLRASFLPFRESLQMRLSQHDFSDTDLVFATIPLESGAVLSRGSVYLIPLLESLNLPAEIRGRCNPKSSTGRLDIFTRVITNNMRRFDEIDRGYQGPLYVEVSPKSFPVRVKTGVSLNQLRLVVGNPSVSDHALAELYRKCPLLYDDGQPVPATKAIDTGLCMGVDLAGEETDGVIGYQAHQNPPAVDLTRLGFHDPGEFWTPIKRTARDFMVLDADRFYILASKERIRVPPELAAEMVVYDPGAGEIRTHYAGFFDPGFGFGDGTLLGTRVVMEVRAREVPFVVYHGQTLFRVSFERLQGRPERLYGVGLDSSYQHQTLTLSKHFRRS